MSIERHPLFIRPKLELCREIDRLRAELVECRAKHMDDLLVLGETAKAERELRAELAGMTDHRRAYMERAERWEASCSRAVAELAECKLSLAAIHAMAHRVSAWTIQRECERAVPELAALAAKGE